MIVAQWPEDDCAETPGIPAVRETVEYLDADTPTMAGGRFVDPMSGEYDSHLRSHGPL